MSKYIRKPDLATIRDLFQGHKTYIVPPYQRSYAWDVDRIEGFWKELLIPDNKSEYKLSFSGSIIIKYDEDVDKSYELIDGQQRYITIFILLAVIRDFCQKKIDIEYRQSNNKKNKEYNKIINGIKERMFSQIDWDDDGTQRLKVGATIDEAFNDIVINTDTFYDDKKKIALNSLRNDNEKRILRNYKKFSEYLEERLKEKKKSNNMPNYKVVIELLKCLDKIELIQINVTDDVAAYEIFETVNSKNEPLTSSDLIKNYILKAIDKQEKKKYETIWNDSIENINHVSGFNFNQFLRYYWISKKGWSTDRKLYANFKKLIEKNRSKIKRKEELKLFLKDLLKNSEYLRILKNPHHNGFIDENFTTSQKNNEKIIKSLITINDLNLKQCYVILLSIFSNVILTKKRVRNADKHEPFSNVLLKMVKKIETFSLFFHTLGKGQANKVEQFYSKFSIEEIEKVFNNQEKPLGVPKATKFWTNKIKDKLESSLDSILSKEEISSSDGLENALNKLDYKKPIDRFIYMYVFEKINQYTHNNSNVDFNENSTIEHILPQNPEKWLKKDDEGDLKSLSKKEVSSYVNKIGNCIIIPNELNRALGNETLNAKLYGVTYKGKIRSYNESKLEHNIELFREVKKHVKKNGDPNSGAEYWDENIINNRCITIAENLSASIKKYLQ